MLFAIVLRVLPRLSRFTGGLPATYWYLWLGTLVNRIGGFVAPFLTLYLTGERHLGVARAALMVSLFGAGSFAASLAGGELADRLGRRPVMLLSFLVTPAVIVSLGLLRSLPLIAVTTLILGFSTDLYRPAVNAAVADLVPGALRVRAYGYIYWAINLGAAVAPVIAGLMAQRSYLLLFIGDGVTTLLFGLIVMWKISETRPPAGKSEAGRAEPRRSRLGVTLGDPLLMAMVGFALLAGMVYAQGYSTLAIAMSAHGVGPAQYGAAIAVNGLLIVLLGIPAANSAHRWPRLLAMAAAALVMGTGFGMTRFVHAFPWYAASVAVWTLGEILIAAVAPSVVADLAPVQLRGLYQGFIGAAHGLSFFAGPALGGWVFQRFGAPALWSGCFLACLLVAAGYVAVRGPARRRLTRA